MSLPAALSLALTVAAPALAAPTLAVPPLGGALPAPAGVVGTPYRAAAPSAASATTSSSASASSAPSGRAARRWAWPVTAGGAPPAVLRGFDPPNVRWASGHRGVDLAAEPGQEVLAVDDGVVAFAGSVAGRGTVSIDHPGGLRSTMEPVAAAVHVGDRVQRGEVVGHLAAGTAHCPGTACLHVGAVLGRGHGRGYVDPAALFGLAHPVLLPLDAVVAS